MMKKTILATLVTLLMCPFAKAGEPVSGVEVFVESMPGNEAVESLITDSKGHFRVSKLPKGDYEIRFLMEENKDFSKEVKSSNRLYKKYSSSLKAGFKENKKAVLFSSVAGTHLIKSIKTKNSDVSQLTPVVASEYVGSKELVTVAQFSILEDKGLIKGKIQSYPLKKYLKKVGKNAFPIGFKRQNPVGGANNGV